MRHPTPTRAGIACHRSARYPFGVRFSSWLVAWCFLAATSGAHGQQGKEAAESRVEWSLMLQGRTFRSAKEVEYSLRDAKAGPGKEAVRSVELELRQGDVRLARWPFSHEVALPEGVKDERKGKRQGYLDGLPGDLLQWMGGLAAGEYELAFVVNGLRATNVAAFRIDPAFAEATAPVFEVGALEPPPRGGTTRPLLWVLGPEQADRRITTMSVAEAPWQVDGVERKRSSLSWAGMVSIVAWGERYALPMDAKQYSPPVDEKAAHEFTFELAGHRSNTLRIDPLTAPLGKAWDAAVVRPAPERPVSVHGVVTDAKGKPAAGYRVLLQTQVHTVASSVTDAQGAYALPGTLRYGMYELVVAKHERLDPRRSEMIAWDGKAITRDFDFREPAGRNEPPAVPKGKLAYFDLEKVEAQLGKGLNVNARDENGNTALAMAITCRKPDLARKLVEAGAEVNTTRGDHTSMLALAIISGDRELVEYLLAKGADVNRVEGYGFTTPLMVAARRGSMEFTELLLAHGAKVDARSRDGKGVIEWALSGSSPEVIALLARRGADVNTVNDRGNTPLMSAASAGNAADVETLIAAGADVNASNQDGWTPLVAATFCQAPRGDYPGIARALLKAGARMDARTELGETPVTQAAKRGRADLLGVFREAGAKVYYESGGKVFADAGTKIDARDARGMIQKAIQDRQYGVMEELAKMGLDMNAPIYHGYTPLIYAITFREDPKAVKTLIAAGADVNRPLIETSGEPTPLLIAARQKMPT